MSILVHAGKFSSQQPSLIPGNSHPPTSVVWINTRVAMFLHDASLPDPYWVTQEWTHAWLISIWWVPCLWFLKIWHPEDFSDRSYKLLVAMFPVMWKNGLPWEGIKQTYRKKQRWKMERVLVTFRPTAILPFPVWWPMPFLDSASQ